MSVRPGECFECAFWLRGDEPEERRDLLAEDIREAFADLAQKHGVTITPAKFYLLNPGEARCPPVPDHISGPCVVLLVGEAMIVGWAPAASPAGSFVQDLDGADRERLRAITRTAHRGQWPMAPRLTDAQCDEIAEMIGPESACAAIREAANSRTVH